MPRIAPNADKFRRKLAGYATSWRNSLFWNDTYLKNMWLPHQLIQYEDNLYNAEKEGSSIVQW